MTDLASDHDAAIELIIGKYRRLKAHDPKHELLQYVTNVTDNGFENVRDKYEAFLERFETPEDKKLDQIKVAKVLLSYYDALKEAVDKIEGIDRIPKKPVSVTPIKTLDKLDDLPL